MVAPPKTTTVIVNNSDVTVDASSRCFIGTPVYATDPQSVTHRSNKPVDKTTRPFTCERTPMSTFSRTTLCANVHLYVRTYKSTCERTPGRLLFVNLCCLNAIYVVYIFNARCTLTLVSTDLPIVEFSAAAIEIRLRLRPKIV
jgi:hypothetical protein